MALREHDVVHADRILADGEHYVVAIGDECIAGSDLNIPMPYAGFRLREALAVIVRREADEISGLLPVDIADPHPLPLIHQKSLCRFCSKMTEAMLSYREGPAIKVNITATRVNRHERNRWKLATRRST